jgi:hypothetical protein
MNFFVKLPPCLVEMEACWELSRTAQALGRQL